MFLFGSREGRGQIKKSFPTLGVHCPLPLFRKAKGHQPGSLTSPLNGCTDSCLSIAGAYRATFGDLLFGITVFYNSDDVIQGRQKML